MERRDSVGGEKEGGGTVSPNYKIIIYRKLQSYNRILTETFLLKLFLFYIFLHVFGLYYYKEIYTPREKKGEIEVIYFIAEFLWEISFMKENTVI